MMRKAMNVYLSGLGLAALLLAGCAADAPKGDAAANGGPASQGTKSAQVKAANDARLEDFIVKKIQDPQQADKIRAAGKDMSLEDFILGVYTGDLQTGPNANEDVMNALGYYLGRAKPKLGDALAPKLEEFYNKPGNRSMLRGAILNTVKGLSRSSETP